MSNSDFLKYKRMEEQMEQRRSVSQTTHDLVLTFPEPPAIKVNNKGEIIFDEVSLGMLDEHIRKVVREEMQTMKTALFKEFEQHLAQQIRISGGISRD